MQERGFTGNTTWPWLCLLEQGGEAGIYKDKQVFIKFTYFIKFIELNSLFLAAASPNRGYV